MQEDRPDAAPAPATPAASERRNVLQNALSAIERLQARIDASEAARHEPIAIVGMGCRVPGGAEDPDAFWQLLSEGRDAVGEVPAERWDVDAYYDPDPSKPGKARTKAGGFLSRIDGFEPGFFGMSPREALGVDPQQRLLLEVAWEALEHAGVPADQLDGSLTGVFVGITSTDYAQRIDVADPARSDIYLATGTALNVAAGRIAFTLGLRGPCMAIDTACSSSLVAIHAACQSLRDRESNLVLAGGVNVMLSPDPFVLISKWGMLSPDGRCKTFDASANGFVRGEGCGLLVLERLSDAVAHGRRVLAVIAGSAINQDGRSSGLTVPNGLAQQEVVRQALAAARLKPTDVGYVEAHGTGTSLGDPIEVEALAAAYGEGRPMDQPLELGSVKSNIGHLEAASGVVSVIKLVMALKHRQLPASLHVRQLTPAIDWARLPVRVSTTLHDWLPRNGRRIAGVSAFGFSGMNAHLLIEEAPAATPTTASAANGAAQAAPQRPLFALPISARSEAALAALATCLAEHLERHPDEVPEAVCATAALGRAHLPLRQLLVAPHREGLVAQLRALASGEDAPRAAVAAGGRTRIAFLFTGQGAQYAGMGRELDAGEPVFRATLDRCAAVLDPLLGRPLRTLMFDATDGSLDQTGFTQPALYALEVSLAALWRSWGIEPSVVIGHSVGEFAAAAVAGVFSLEDGARLIAARARLMQALPAGGAMVSVQGDVEAVKREVATAPDKVSIAAFNAPGNVVIAGSGADVEAIAARLASRGLRTQALQVSHAFHSPLMAPMLEEFRGIAAGVEHAAPQLNWISNLSGATLDWSHWGARMADYWTRHVREPVAFDKGMAVLGATGCEVHLEIGPHPTLIGLGRQNLPEAAGEWLPSLHRKRGAWEQMLDSVGRLYTRGARIDWAAFHGSAVGHSLALPTYPFQRERFLIPFAARAQRPQGSPVHELLGVRLPVAGVRGQFERRVNATDPAWLPDHRIASEVVMPMTAYLEASLAALRQTDGAAAAIVDDMEVAEPMVLREGEARAMQVVVDAPEAGAPARVRIFSRDAASDDTPWSLHASARAGTADAAPSGAGGGELLAARAAALPHEVEVGPFYDKLRDIGADFGPGFRCMKRVRCGSGEAIGEIELDDSLAGDADHYLMHPALLDACFHVSAVAIDSLPGGDDNPMYLLTGVDRYRWFAPARGVLRSHARLRAPATRADQMQLDVQIETLDGTPVARLEGLRCRRASRDMFRRRTDARVADWCYEVAWQAQPPATDTAAGRAAGRWLVLDDGAGRGERLAEAIERRGGQVLRVVPADAPDAGTAATTVAIDAADAAAYAHLVARVAEGGAIAGVVSLWPLRMKPLALDERPGAVQALGTESALLLLQALASARLEPAPRVWFVTAGSQTVDGTEALRLEQTPVAGLARVAASEHPELRVSTVDLDPQAHATDAPALADELLADADEPRLAWRKGTRFVARLVHHQFRHDPHVDDAPLRLDIHERGTLENLAIEPDQRRSPGPGEVELRVRASGLNFRDVLGALGLYPGELRRLGSDCAGEITAVGAGVTQFALGDRVVAMVEGAFASHAVTRWEFVAPLPRGLDFEQGAAIPTAYLTAEITLNLIGRMKRGDRVLIHSGAGGVGMAAIALAQRAGAEVFATAGSADKRAVLARLGVPHVLDSRSTSFGDEVLRLTQGRGVDLVLNSLTGALLDKSFECLADGGVFLEIGKRGLWSHERVAALNRGLRYQIVDCSDNARDTPQLVGEIFTRVLKDIESGALPQLPCTTFAFERAAEAFRHMAQARHIGRVVFRHRIAPRRSDAPVRGDASYLVTGGLKGLGLLAAQWLVGQGARHLVLAGRSAPDAAAAQAIASMETAGARVVVVSADLASDAGVARLMNVLDDGMPALGGVLHGAAVLDDGMLANQSAARLAGVMGPKADGAWGLHAACEARGLRPDFFVLYSSLSAVLGAAGQANYVAANAFLDALAQQRRAQGLEATSIAWGAWSEVGMATRGNTVARAGAQGLSPIGPTDGRQALDLLLREQPAQVAVAPIDWPALTAQLGDAPVPALLRTLVAEARSRAERQRGAQGQREQRIDYTRLEPALRLPQLVALVRREVATVLGLIGAPESIALDQPFPNLGLDSLTAVELRNRLQGATGRTVPPTAAFDWPTVAEMARQLDALFGGAVPGAAGRGDQDDAANREEMTL